MLLSTANSSFEWLFLLNLFLIQCVLLNALLKVLNLKGSVWGPQ